jgi:hypothetical protein
VKVVHRVELAVDGLHADYVHIAVTTQRISRSAA